MCMNERWPLFATARAAVKKLGADLRDARRRRRIATATLAERARISRATLYRIERGDPGVSMSSYAAVIFALGLIDNLRDAMDLRNDPIGLNLEVENLPKRITNKRYVP